MNHANKTVLVIGATGQQGGAAARNLLSLDWSVRIFCRDASKPQARVLADRGAKVSLGDLDDADSLRNAMTGCYGVFAVTMPSNGPDVEVQQGKLVADLAAELGVKHLVFTSVASADRNTGIPHFDTKRQVEQYISQKRLAATVIRPVWFMDNFSTMFRRQILDGVLSLPLKPTTRLQMIAVEDIGRIAASCFERPQGFIGKSFDIAAEDLSLERTAEMLGEAIGRPVRYMQQPIEQMRQANPDYAVMFEWFERVGYSVDIAMLRSRFPEMMSFEDWLHFAGWQRAGQEAPVSAGR